MKSIIISGVIMLSFAAFARGGHELSPEAIEQGKRNLEKMRIAVGGFIGDKRNAEGAISFVDAQKLVKAEQIKKRLEKIEDTTFMVCKYSRYDAGAVDFGNLDAVKKLCPGNLWVILTENATMPNLVSLPEQRAVIINVAALNKDKPDAAKLEVRVAKELARAVCFAFVVRYSSKSGGLMYSIESTKDLDSILVEQLGVDSIANIDRESRLHYGIKRFPRKTYRQACEEGWAPAPKDEHQKRIWDEVHTMPTKPIKIKPETKKVAE